MGTDALICFDGKPVAGLRNVSKPDDGLLYGSPIWRDIFWKAYFQRTCRDNEIIDLEIFSHEHGDRAGLFRVRSHLNNELSFRRVGE